MYVFSRDSYICEASTSLQHDENRETPEQGGPRAGFDPGWADQKGFWCFQASVGSSAINEACPEARRVCFRFETHFQVDFDYLCPIFPAEQLRKRYCKEIMIQMVQIHLGMLFCTETTLSYPEIYCVVLGTLVGPYKPPEPLVSHSESLKPAILAPAFLGFHHVLG